MYNLSQKLGSMEYDNLISDLTQKPQVRAGTLAHGGEEISLKRGTILEKDGGGKLHILGTKPNGSVTEDFNGDGATTTFTLTANPLPLAVKGAKVGTADAVIDSYNAQTGVVTLHAAPAAGTLWMRTAFPPARPPHRWWTSSPASSSFGPTRT